MPGVEAIARLRRLADLRWIIVHPNKISERQRAQWRAAAKAGHVELTHTSPNARIYRIPEHSDGGSSLSALASPELRERTLAGHSRQALGGAPGRLRVATPDTLRFLHNAGLETWVEVEIRNDSERLWPGYDPQREGLVELRYRFIDATGATIHKALAGRFAIVA